MNWTDNYNALAQYAGDSGYVVSNDADFLAQMPRFIEAGELRILRDLDLISTIVSDTSGKLDADHRRFVLPLATGIFVVVHTVRVVVNNVQQPALDWISRDAFDYVWANDGPVGNPSIPRNVAPFDSFSLLVGPAPDQAYNAVVTGTQRPQSLSIGMTLSSAGVPQIAQATPAATGTFISLNLPDLFLAAQMINVSAWQRQFSAMGDEPESAVSWVSEYEKLKTPALVEEARKKLQSLGWGSRLPSPAEVPQIIAKT